MRRITAALLLLVSLPTLAACTSTTVKGRVVVGDLSQIIRVPETDDRLDADGIDEIVVEVSQGGILGDNTTDNNGDFSISIPDQSLQSGRIRVRAEGETIFRVDKLVDLPRPGEALLIQAIRRTPQP